MRKETHETVKAALEITGIILFVSDGPDVGKIDRVHHWQIGAFLALLGVLV